MWLTAPKRIIPFNWISENGKREKAWRDNILKVNNLIKVKTSNNNINKIIMNIKIM
jgi:hypothetical protein